MTIRFPSAPAAGWPQALLHFDLPQLVADTVTIDTLVARGRAAGVPDDRFGYSNVNTAPGMLRITASVPMTIYLVETLKENESGAVGDTLVACVTACMTILKAMKKAADRGRPTSLDSPSR